MNNCQKYRLPDASTISGSGYCDKKQKLWVLAIGFWLLAGEIIISFLPTDKIGVNLFRICGEKKRRRTTPRRFFINE
jgi:hypothetical protein